MSTKAKKYPVNCNICNRYAGRVYNKKHKQVCQYCMQMINRLYKLLKECDDKGIVNTLSISENTFNSYSDYTHISFKINSLIKFKS